MPNKITQRRHTSEIFADMLDPKSLPKDLAIIIIWLALSILTIYIPAVNESFIRVVFTTPLILFIPGYVLIAALFPNKYKVAEEGSVSDKNISAADVIITQKKRKGINGIERFVLSIALSVAIVPLLGFIFNYTSFGIRLEPILISLAIFTIVMILLTLYRRASLPEEERFNVPFEKVFPAIKKEMFQTNKERKWDKVLSVILIVVIVAAVITVIFVIACPLDGEKFTEFYILGPDKTAADYPNKFPAGSEQSVWVGIANHEFQDITYTVETLLLDAEWDSDTNSSVIYASKPLDCYQVTVANGETSLERYSFTITDTEYNRLEFLLYNESVPPANAAAQIKIDSAYRKLHLWIEVT